MKVLLLLVCIAVTQGRRTYEGYKVFEMFPSHPRQADHVNVLSQDVELDMWAESRVIGHASRVMVPPHRVDDVERHLKEYGVRFSIIDHNVQEAIDEERAKLIKRFTIDGARDFDYDDFNTYEDIQNELDVMAADCPAALTCTVSVLGQSYGGRDISLLKVEGPGSDKKGVWIDSTIHAREWLAPATILRVMDKIVRGYDDDDDVRHLVDGYDWYFVPVMNPDGYVYSWTNDRLWRKSRRPNEGSTCVGTDLNRNYDANWMVSGASNNPCSNTYAGPSAASDVETKIIEEQLVALGDDLIALLTVHTAATMWLIPWGHQEDGVCVIAEDDDEMMRVLDIAVDAVENTYNEESWPRGNSCLVIYTTSGSSQDFAKQSGVKYSITPELRGSGFVVPATEIDPSFQETWNGIVALIYAIEDQ